MAWQTSVRASVQTHPSLQVLDEGGGHGRFAGSWDVPYRSRRPRKQDPGAPDFLNRGRGARMFRTPRLNPPVDGIHLDSRSAGRRAFLLRRPPAGMREPRGRRRGLGPVASELRAHQCRTREQGGPKCDPADNCISRTQGRNSSSRGSLEHDSGHCLTGFIFFI